MEPERVDLSALDAMSDRLLFQRLVRRVMTAAGPELERRAASQTTLAMLGVWARPLLIAAAVVAILAGGVLVATDRDHSPGQPAMVVDDLGVPAPAADWLAAGREPTRADLVLAMERRR